MRKQSDQSGFSLVQILMGVTIVSILSVGVMALLDNMNQQLTRTRTMGTRDALVRQVKDIIQTASSYSYTLGLQDKDNATFKLCMEGATPPANDLCIAKDAADQPLTYGVSFYGVGGTQAVSGGLGNPAKYNADGTKCDAQNQANCPLEVETWFQPICIVGKDCAKADDLLVFFSVKSAANAQYQVKTISNIGTPTAYSTLTRVLEPPPPDVLAGGGGGGGNFSCFSFNDPGPPVAVKPFCCTMIANTLACTEVVKQANVASIEGGPKNAAFYAGSLSEKFGTWKKRGYMLSPAQNDGNPNNWYIKGEGMPSTGSVGHYANEAPARFAYRGACPDLSSACLLPAVNASHTCSVNLGTIPISKILYKLDPNRSLAHLMNPTVSDVYECTAAP